MKQIVNARVVTPDGIIENGTVVFNEKIVKITEAPLPDTETLDAGGNYLIPGLIDLHIHGYNGADTVDGTLDALQTIAGGIIKNGVTAFLPTTMTVGYDSIERSLDAARELQKLQKTDPVYSVSGAEVLGVHAEGPFISIAKKGAQNAKYIKTPDADFIKKHSDIIKLVTLAPEEDEDFKAIKKIKTETDTVISVGHTTADYDTMMGAIEAGATHATHLFNAMSPISHRSPNCTGAMLFSDKVSCELICDGVHVHPAWFEPVYRLKKRKLNLITDCLRACGLPDGSYELGGQTFNLKGNECRLPDGVIAGSVLKLNQAVANLHKSGVPLHEAVACASLYPAETLGVSDRLGSIETGKAADLVICTPEMDIISVFKNGREVQ